MFFTLLVIAAVWLFYKWLTSGYDYFAKQGVPFVKPYPFVGSLLGPMLQKESVVDVTTRYYDKFKSAKSVRSFSTICCL